MARIGADPAGIAVMEPKGRLRLVKLDAVPLWAANILKQEMLAVGGEAAVSRQAMLGGASATDCLLMGTLAHYQRLGEKLNRQPLGLAPVGAEIQRALSAFDGPLATELRCGECALLVGQRTLVMGVINATPDSFSGDGLAGDVEAMIERGEQMAAEGADLLDIGGESTRPGAEAVDAETEMARVVPVIDELRRRVSIPISIDTYKAVVARAALDAGATIINDISALRGDAELAPLAAERGAPVVVMHMRGTPRTMQDNPQYDDLMGEIAAYLRHSVDLAERAGVPRDQVIIDPGFGFGKTVHHNLEIVRRLRELRSVGQPVLLGPSRKSSIGRVLDLPPEERLEGTLAVLTLAIANGADMVRVHDVRPAVRAARMTDAVVRGWAEP
jgi:dihydropteroate synthase